VRLLKLGEEKKEEKERYKKPQGKKNTGLPYSIGQP